MNKININKEKSEEEILEKMNENLEKSFEKISSTNKNYINES